MRRGTTTLLALAVLAGAAYGAPRADDYDFAQKLVERRWYDLAEAQFRAIIKESASVEQKAGGELGLAMLKRSQASDQQGDSRKTSQEVLATFEQAEGLFEAFLTAYANHPRRTDAKFELGNLLNLKGTYLTRLATEDESKAAEYRKAADKVFADAIMLFEDVSAALASVKRSQDEGAWFNRQKALYYISTTYHLRGLLYPEGSSDREAYLKRCYDQLLDFLWDNDQNILGGYAYFYLGMTQAERDEPAEALSNFQYAASVYQVPKQGTPDYALWSDLFLQAYYKMGEYCNRMGRTDAQDFREHAVSEFEKMMQRVPDVYDRKIGHFALLEYARALTGLGRYEKAIEIVTKVSQRGEQLAPVTDWGAATAFNANRLLVEIIAEGGSQLSLPPEDLMRAAAGKKTSREWEEAIRAFHSVLNAVAGKPEEAEFAAKAWLEIGECYYRGDKFVEAYHTYRNVSRKYAADKLLAGDAAYMVYRAATALHAMTKDAADEELKRNARSDFAKNFPDHPKAVDLQYYEGADMITDADSKRADGDMAAASPIYREAIEFLQGVKPTSVLYSKALARIGEVHYQLGEDEKALAQFAALRKYVQDDRTNQAERIANREQALAISAYYAARTHARRSAWDKVLAELAEFEKKFADENVANFHPVVQFERIKAFLGQAKLSEAEQQLLRMRDQFPEHGVLPFAAQMVALEYQKSADAALEKKDEATWRKHLGKAAEYYAFWLDRNPKTGWRDLYLLGDWHQRLGGWAAAEGYFRRAHEGVTADRAKLGGNSPERKKLEDAAAVLDRQLSDVLMKQGKHAEAIELFERLLVPNEAARERVFKLLEAQSFTEKELSELLDKMEKSTGIMEGLAQVYLEVAKDPQMLLRAMTLSRILTRGAAERYGADWWRWQTLHLKAQVKYGENYRDGAMLDAVIKTISGYESIGLLDRSPNKQELLDLRSRAEIAKRRS